MMEVNRYEHATRARASSVSATQQADEADFAKASVEGCDAATALQQMSEWTGEGVRRKAGAAQ
jgi:hypothetical protein